MKKQKCLLNYIAVCLISLFTIAGIVVSLHRFWQYQTFFYDLGIFDQAIWRVSRLKKPLIDEFGGKIVFADHFYPSLFIFSALFWFTSKTEIILIGQAVSVGLSLVLAFLIVRKELKSKIASLALIIAYGGYIGLQNALVIDFHSLTVSVVAIMLLFWTIYNKKWKLFWFSLLFFLGFKENMGLVGATIGIFLFFKYKKHRKKALLAIFISIFYSFMATQIIIPFFKGAQYQYRPYIPGSLKEFINLLFGAEIKLKTILVSFSTFSFLPLFFSPLWPAFFYHFVERFVFNLAGTRWDLGLHYNALLSPLMFIASMEVLKKIEKRKIYKKLIIPISLSIIFIVIFHHRFFIHGPLGLAYHPVFYQHTKRMQFMDKFIDKIPKEGLLMTQNNLAPQFTHNKVVLLRSAKKYSQIKPDYVALDLRGGQNGNNFFPLSYDDSKKLKQALLQDDNYKLMEHYDSFYIFKREK